MNFVKHISAKCEQNKYRSEWIYATVDHSDGFAYIPARGTLRVKKNFSSFLLGTCSYIPLDCYAIKGIDVHKTR